MESYLEVSFLHNMCTIALSMFLGEYAAIQPVALYRILLYAMIISALGCLGWFPYAMLLLFLLEVLAFFFFFRHAYKAYACGWVVRLLLHASAFVFYGGGFHNGMWFVPMDTGVAALWIVYGVIGILLMVKWKDVFSRLSYIYEVTMHLPRKQLKMKSYLDSGNLLTYQHIPIIFVDKKYQTYFQNQRIELVVMNSIQASEVIRCYECDIQIAGCKKQHVYINCDQHLQLPFECDVLLNMNMMTMG